MKKDDDKPPSRGGDVIPSPDLEALARLKPGPMSWLKDLLSRRPGSNDDLKEALEEYIDELNEQVDSTDPVFENQKILIANVLKTRDMRVDDIMVPRTDIVALPVHASAEDLKNTFRENQFSRLPVYGENLDDILGLVHIKDVLATLLENKEIHIASLVRDAMIVGSSLPVMDLFIALRNDRKHMAVVVDEHGGVDGLVTLNDVIESIVGDLDDEFDREDQPQMIEKSDGSVVANARLEIEELEERYGPFLSDEEREEIDTVGGLAFSLAGRIPKRGEILDHSSGLRLEILDAKRNRVQRVLLKNLPTPRRDMDQV